MKTTMYTVRWIEDFLKAFSTGAPTGNHSLFDTSDSSEAVVFTDKKSAEETARFHASSAPNGQIALVQIEVKGDFVTTMAHQKHRVEHNELLHTWKFGPEVCQYLNENSEAWMTVVSAEE